MGNRDGNQHSILTPHSRIEFQQQQAMMGGVNEEFSHHKKLNEETPPLKLPSPEQVPLKQKLKMRSYKLL